MERRKFLYYGVGGLVGASFTNLFPQDCYGNTTVQGGWVRPLTNKFFRYNRLIPKKLLGTGSNRRVLLHKYLEKAIGPLVPHNQGTGDCVGQGFARGVDILGATQIYGIGMRQSFKGEASAEVIYAGSRYEIGYEKHKIESLLRHEGSAGILAAQFLKEFGSIVRDRYGDIDLSEYSSNRSDDWGKTGIPDELEEIARQHPVRAYALVKSYSDVRDAIVNGYPVVICSGVGFNPQCDNCNPGGRDSMGFLQPCGDWNHCMLVIGIDDTERPGALILNSWGPDWVTGGTRLGQPVGSFWADSKAIDKICAAGDSFAISNYKGFTSNDLLDYRLF